MRTNQKKSKKFIKRLLVLVISLSGLLFPWACSDNNNAPKNPIQPGGGGGNPTATFTPGVPVGTPTFTNTPTPTGTLVTMTFTPTGTLSTPTQTFTPTLTWTPIATPIYVSEWPAGSAPNGFSLAAPTSLYVAENDGVLPYMEVFNPATGAIVDHWNIEATACSFGTTIILGGPQGIAYCPNNANGQFFCLLDSAASSTTLYASFAGGQPWEGPVNSFSWGSQPFKSPQGFATDGKYVYVADTGNGYVEEFDPWAGCPSNLGWIHRWPGYSPNNFLKPSAVAIDPAGNIWVADKGYNPSFIEEFASGGTTWITQWPAVPNCAANGMAVTVDSFGNDLVYISDSANQAVEEYDKNGNLLRQFFNPHGPHEFQPFKPSCIVFDTANNHIIVGDQNNDTIEVFGP